MDTQGGTRSSYHKVPSLHKGNTAAEAVLESIVIVLVCVHSPRARQRAQGECDACTRETTLVAGFFKGFYVFRGF